MKNRTIGRFQPASGDRQFDEPRVDSPRLNGAEHVQPRLGYRRVKEIRRVQAYMHHRWRARARSPRSPYDIGLRVFVLRTANMYTIRSSIACGNSPSIEFL